jgi:hypothetical protein
VSQNSQEQEKQEMYRAANHYRRAKEISSGAIIFVDDVTFDKERHVELSPDEAAVR